MTSEALAQKRNKNFDQTHQMLIETAVRIISEKGAEALSMAALAREIGLNRTTVYYHFASRDDLLAAVRSWSSEQMGKAFDTGNPQLERIEYIVRFVLDHPALIKLWIDEFLSGGDIRVSFPAWDEIVEGIDRLLGHKGVDAEVRCMMLLTTAFIAPHTFKAKLYPNADNEEIVERFRAERVRMLQRDGILRQ